MKSAAGSNPARGRNICLALGGGGARALATLGVIKVLEEAEVPINMIVGVSFGALVGASYALTPVADIQLKTFQAFFESPAFGRLRLVPRPGRVRGALDSMAALWRSRQAMAGRLVRRKSIFRRRVLASIVAALLPDKRFEDVLLPFTAAALDLVGGREVVFERGPLRAAVMGACAVPGYFQPVAQGEALLVDLAALGAVPVALARQQGADVVIGVDLEPEVERPREPGSLARGLDVALRVQSLGAERLRLSQLAAADVVIRPELPGQEWYSFAEDRAAVIRAGREAGEAALPEIRRALAAGETARG